MEESSRAAGPMSPAERQGSAGGPPPPPSPLSGCYLLIVIGEPHSPEHRDIILQRVAKGFLSWDISAAHVDLEKELQALTAQAPEGEEARNGERLIQYATENLVTEVLIHPQVNTLLQCVRNLLSSFTRHRHLVHAGYTFAGTGSWCLQDGTFSLADFIDAFQESEVQRVLRAYENCVTVDIHCSPEGDWATERLSKESFSRLCKVRVNPDDCLTAGSSPIANFINYLSPFLRPASIEQLLEPSDVVGNIRFSHPTLYVFPGGQGDAALFGINGFNMLVDGGFARKACFWDFARHLDRLDAVLITRLNNGNINGISAVLRRKKQGHVYPQIGHFFCNIQERRHCASPDGDKDRDPLLINLADEGHEMVLNLRQLQLRPHACYREGNQVEPVNLYHKVGHGKLDMYIISPARDSREVKEFLAKWNSNDAKLFSNIGKKDSSKEFHFPLQNLVSICALLVWQPANPNDTITRILFPGSTPQHKIFEGLDKLRHLEFLKFPVCSARSLSPSTSTVGISSRVTSKQRTGPAVIDKLLPGEGVKTSRPTSEVNKHASKAATIPVAGSMPEAKPVKASTPVSSAPVPPIAKAPLTKPKADKTPKSELTKPKTETTKLTETEKVSAKTEKITKVSVDGTKAKVDHKSKTETKPTTKSRTDSKPPRSTDRKIQKAGSTEKKTDMKSSPTTPKKSVEAKVNGVAPKAEPSKTARTSSKTRPSPSATPAKSTKEANNRKVVESKYHVSRVSTSRASASKTTKKETTEAPAKVERKPISRRPKTGSPTKAPSGSRPPGSPAKSSSAKSTPTPSVKSEKDGVIRKTKAETERLTTDSSAVSTPSTVDPETALLKTRGVEPEEKPTTLMNGDLTKEEKTVVQEIEDAIAAEEAKVVEREDEEEVKQVKEIAEITETTVETAEIKEETAVEEEITKEEEGDEEGIKDEGVETLESTEAQEETEREAEEEDEEGEIEEKESEIMEDDIQHEKITLEKEMEATEEEQTEDLEDMEEDEAPIDIRESLQAELELEAKRGEVTEGPEPEEEEEEEYLVIEKEEVEQVEESMQEPESLESHIPEDVGEVREIETEEDEGELQKHLRDEADSEKLKRVQEGEVKVNGFHHELEQQVHEEEIVKELDVTIAKVKDEAEVKKEEIGKAIEKQLFSSIQQREDLKEEAPEVVAKEQVKGTEETVIKKEEVHVPVGDSKPEGMPLEAKEQIQEEVQEIISSAKEIVSKTKLESEKKPGIEESAPVKDQSKDESAEEKKETEEVSSTSPEEKLDVSSEKNKEVTEDTRDTDQKFEEQDEAVEVKETGSKEIVDQKYPAEESQPDEKFSTTVESAATTAPTLPEDERIPLDEIKEIVEEKYVKEETKEKEKPVEAVLRFGQPIPLPQVVIPAGIGLFDQHAHHPIIHRDIVKTPDEVADLPVHEEVDPGTYDSEEYPREIPKQKPEVEDIKSPEFDVKGELQPKYEDVAKPSQEDKESKESKEKEKSVPEPILSSESEHKDAAKKIPHEKETQDDLKEADKIVETSVITQKPEEKLPKVEHTEQELTKEVKDEKETVLKTEDESKEVIAPLHTETEIVDEVDMTQILKDTHKPQEISVVSEVGTKEKDIKKDDVKTERKPEAVETPLSEISDIESKDKDTEKGIFKEKEIEITEVKDITSHFISQERAPEIVEPLKIVPESITVQTDLPVTKDEPREDHEQLVEKKQDVGDSFIQDNIEIKSKISSEFSHQESERDVSKFDDKDTPDLDSKFATDIKPDVDTMETKHEDIKIPKDTEIPKTIEDVKEPSILGDSSAISATYLEIIEKLQQETQNIEETTEVSTSLKDQEIDSKSEEDVKTQEPLKELELDIHTTEKFTDEKHKETDEKMETVPIEKEQIEGKEEIEITALIKAKAEIEAEKSLPETEDEIIKKETESKPLPDREIIDLQEQTEISKEPVSLDEKEIIKKPEDSEIILKDSTTSLQPDEKIILPKEKIQTEESESQKEVQKVAIDDVNEPHGYTEFVVTEEKKDIEVINEKPGTEVTDEKEIKETEFKLIKDTDDILTDEKKDTESINEKLSTEVTIDKALEETELDYSPSKKIDDTLIEEKKELDPISVKLSPEVTVETSIKEIELKHSPTEITDAIFEQDSKTQETIDESTDKIPKHILREEEKDLMQTKAEKDDKELEVMPSVLTPTLTDKDIHEEMKIEPLEQKLENIQSDIVESVECVTEDIHQSDQKEIEIKDYKVESEIESLGLEAEATLPQEKETLEIKIKETKVLETKQFSPPEEKVSTEVDKSFIKEDKEYKLSQEEKELMEYEETDSSEIPVKPSTLPEKDLKEVTEIITSSSIIESSKIESIVDSHVSINEASKQEDIPVKDSLEITKESDFGVEKEKENEKQETLTFIPCEKEEIVSKLEKSEKDFVLSQEQHEVEIIDALPSDSTQIADSVVSKEREQIMRTTETDVEDKHKLDSLSESEIKQDKKIEEKQTIESLSETEKAKDTKLDEQEQQQIFVKSRDEFSVQQVEEIGLEMDKETFEIVETQKEKDKTEKIETKDTTPVSEQKQIGDLQISGKDLKDLVDEKLESLQTQKDEISSLTELTTDVSPETKIHEVTDSDILDTTVSKQIESTDEKTELSKKIIDESIPPIHPEQSTAEQTLKQEKQIHDTADQDDTIQLVRDVSKAEDQVLKTVEQITEVDSADKKEDEVSKTEDKQELVGKDESKNGEETAKLLDDHKGVNGTEEKIEVKDSINLGFEETECAEQKLVEESESTRKDSLKTEEKIERDTVVTEKQEPRKEELTTQPKADHVDPDTTNTWGRNEDKPTIESQDLKKSSESQDEAIEKEDREQKSFYDQKDDDAAGDGEPPPSPGDEYIDSGLEEEPVFTKLEAPEHPEYVMVTPDSTPASPKALPSFVKSHEEEKDTAPSTHDIDSHTKIDVDKKDVEDTFKKQLEKADISEVHEKVEDTLQKAQKVSEFSVEVEKQISDKKVTDTTSKFETFDSSTIESSSFTTKSGSPPKSPQDIVFKEEIKELVISKSICDKEEVKATETYDKISIAEAKMLDDSIDTGETITYSASSTLTKEVDEFLVAERRIEETIRATQETTIEDSSISATKVTKDDSDLTMPDPQKQLKETKLEESSTTSTHIGKTIVCSISDTKISEKAEIESSEKEIMKSSMEEFSDPVKELELTTAKSSETASDLASTSEVVNLRKSIEETTEQTTTEGTSMLTTILSETKELTDTEKLEEDSTSSTTVKKMLVTASSEDGGAETVLCATGTIKTADIKQSEKTDSSSIGEKTSVEKETFSKEEKECIGDTDMTTRSDEEKVQTDSCSDVSTEKLQMKPTHPTVTDVKHTNGHLHESDVDIQSTDEEEIVDGKKIIRTKTTKTTTTTKVIRKSVSESTDSEDEHKDSVTEETEIGEDGKIITRKITRTYKTIVKEEDESEKLPSTSVYTKYPEFSKLPSESSAKDSIMKCDELLADPEPALTSTSSTTTTTTVTKIVSGSDGEEIVKSITEKLEENGALKSMTVTTTEKHGDTEVKTSTEITEPKSSDADECDMSKVSSGSEVHSSEFIETTQSKGCVETSTIKSEIIETASGTTQKFTEESTFSVTTDIHDAEKELKAQEDPLHTLSGSVAGPLALIKKETVEIIRSSTPGSDAMSDRDFDIGGPSTPHSDISSGQVSRAATNIWGSEGHPGSQHYDSDEEEEGPVSPLSVTSQVAPSPPPPHFDFETSERRKSPEMEGKAKHSTISSLTEEHTKQSTEILKGPQQALTSSMTSSFYGSLPAEPPLSPQSFTMKAVDPMSASFIMESEDPEHKELFSHTEYSTYTYGEYEEEGESARFEHFSSTSQVDPDETVDFQQALYEHRATRGEDLTGASTSTTYQYDTKLKESPEKTISYEQTTTSGVNGQRKDHSFREFTEDYGNGNLAGAKQFEDLMNRNRELVHDLESKLNGKRAEEYSDLSGPTSTESYSQEVFTTTKVSTMDPTFIRNGSDEKKTITTTVTTVTKTITGAEADTHTTQSFTGPSTASQAFPEPPQGFGLPSASKSEAKKDPIEGWGKPLGLPAPAPPPTNNTNAQGDVMGMTNTNKGTPKKEKKVMQMKKSMMISENNKTTGGQMGKDKTKSPESPVKQKTGSNKVGISNIKSSVAPIYVDLSYVPHHGNSYYTAVEFFKKVRARYYVFSGTEPSREVYNALLEAKQTWEDKELEVTIIPTYDTDTLGYWVAENEDALAKCKIDLSPSASRCTINLQDHETSCSAYRLEF